MKRQIPAFLSGMLTAALIGILSVSALAASGQMTITVDPINIQVNGQTFQPKDVNGNDVPIFAFHGTTYAPLRALAEAYGLEVWYNKELNMATVTMSEGVNKSPENEIHQDKTYEFRNQNGEISKYGEEYIDTTDFRINGTKFKSNIDGVPATVNIGGADHINFELFMEIYGENITFEGQFLNFMTLDKEVNTWYTFGEFHYVKPISISTFLRDVMGTNITHDYNMSENYIYFEY